MTNNKYAVRCKTKEEFNRLMNLYDQVGWLWPLGAKATSKVDYFENREMFVDFNDCFILRDKPYLHFGQKIISVDKAEQKLKDMGLLEEQKEI